ncbi:MAG: HD domain-containing protein [Treponema sp.]|nr:HD domain-containing protein [Treponema sp.]
MSKEEKVVQEDFLSEDSFNVSAMNDEFEMDSINNWSTAIGLVKSVIGFIEKKIPTCKAHIFMHLPEYHEYREIDREGITSFSDDSVFIGCLSMESGVIPLEKMFSNYQIEDPMVNEVIKLLYQGRYLMPVVHGFEMIAYVLLCATSFEQEGEILTQENIELLKRLNTRLQVNLYAVSIAARGQRNLLTMAKYPFILQRHESIMDVNANVFEDMKGQIAFERGIAYRYDELSKTLYPFSFYKVDRSKVPMLQNGEGISGQAFKNWKAVFIPDRASHPTYSVMEEEQFFKGSVISVPLGNEQHKIGVITVSHRGNGKETFSLEHQYLLEIAAAFLATELINRDLRNKIEANNMNMVKSLSSALEAKDLYTEGHSDRVAQYSVGIARRLGYDEERINMLRYGAQLHDIGKIGIADGVLNKPSGLNADERKAIENHTEIGYKILSANPYFKDVKDFVRYHHEALDGSGYNKKTRGEYPEEAMIISCADIYDALTTDRPYRKALSRKQAFQILSTDIDKNFTKEIFDALVYYIENEAPTEA